MRKQKLNKLKTQQLTNTYNIASAIQVVSVTLNEAKASIIIQSNLIPNNPIIISSTTLDQDGDIKQITIKFLK